jgi:hypothetical protein
MCEESRIVWPRALASSAQWRNSTSISGSKPLVGSSKISKSARVASAAISWTFCRLPFDNARTFLRGSRSTRAMSSSRYAYRLTVQSGEEVQGLRAG